MGIWPPFPRITVGARDSSMMFRLFRNITVIPAKAGIHRFLSEYGGGFTQGGWIPDFAGMTVRVFANGSRGLPLGVREGYGFLLSRE